MLFNKKFRMIISLIFLKFQIMIFNYYNIIFYKINNFHQKKRNNRIKLIKN